MKTWLETIGAIVIALIGFAVIIAICLAMSAGFAYLAMLAYGVIAPALGLPALTFWQVWAALFLLSIIRHYLKPSSSQPSKGDK